MPISIGTPASTSTASTSGALTLDSPGITGASNPRARRQVYSPVLPYEMPLTATARTQADRIAAWLSTAAAVVGVDAPKHPRLRDGWRKAVSRREPVSLITADIAARVEIGEEELDDLVAEAATRVASATSVLDGVAAYLEGAEFRSVATQLDEMAALVPPFFDAAAEKLTEAAAMMPSPLDSRPSPILGYTRETTDADTWDARGPLAFAQRTNRRAAEAAFMAEEAIGTLSALALKKDGPGFLSEVVAQDEDADPKIARGERERLSSFASHNVPDLALVSIARGDFETLSLRLAR